MEAPFSINATRAFWTIGELYTIIDTMPTPVSWASIGDGTIGFVNRAFTDVFGYTSQDLSTVDDWMAYYVRQDEREALGRHWALLRDSTRRGVTIIPPLEVTVRCRDGSVTTVQSRGTVLHDLGIGVAVFEDISLQKQAEEALRRIASEDALTGIPNRRGLQREWQRLISQTSRLPDGFSLLLADLDGFKTVNDQWGHDIGDCVLVEATRRLRSAVGEDGMLCRLGGDEFAVFLPDGTGHRSESLARRIQAAFQAPVAMRLGAAAQLGVSIGASRFPAHGKDLRSLLRHADEALYQVKRHGKGGFAWFTASGPGTQGITH